MIFNDFPAHIKPHLIPNVSGHMVYRCLGCNSEHTIDQLLYTCPHCESLLLLADLEFDRHKAIPKQVWRDLFDYRRMLNVGALRGIFRYHEFIGPSIPLDAVVYLGEAHTPMVEANSYLQDQVGIRFFFKNDGQNPSASFKDRGMASAMSYINYLVSSGRMADVLSICASTGDTSASAALYASYLAPALKSAVLLPHGKVTAQQLAQPLGSGARVFEIPGVFDDAMKVVEALSRDYNVALLNSKNAWRILGQESYSYEISQDFDYDLTRKTLFVPIGNAGNITAIMSGFLKFLDVGIIEQLPKIVGVQSAHANPVFKYYLEPNQENRKFVSINVRPSVAQAAMIGNPVSMPRVIELVNKYNQKAGGQAVFVVEVKEQDIMDWQLLANRNGHVACTQGGETLAGLIAAKRQGLVTADETVVLDSTAHALKFVEFQQMYFEDRFPADFEVVPQKSFQNAPSLVRAEGINLFPDENIFLAGADLERFVELTSKAIAQALGLSLRTSK